MSEFARHDLLAAYGAVRRLTEELCAPLAVEDYVVQPQSYVSPPKWHLAHTTWFYETFILQARQRGYTVHHPDYSYLFNSYYDSVGSRVAQPFRGTRSRPTVEQVYAYRAAVDQAMHRFIEACDGDTLRAIAPVLDIGLHHEQQHQELLLTDIKHILLQPPLYPAYHDAPTVHGTPPDAAYREFTGGEVTLGHRGEGFSFDNEGPAHRVLLAPFRLAHSLVSNGEFRAFVEDGGYERPDHWLSDGWSTRIAEAWEAPLYWVQQDGQWFNQTLHGLQPLVEDAPVTHVSFYEAAAFASWAGKRLPTEAEWECAAREINAHAAPGTLLEDGGLHPVGAPVIRTDCPRHMVGEVWEWTASAYLPYPGYRRPPGAFGEYNGKFMANQMVLRGGSCATPKSHIRLSYRNFFHCDKRWQFSGIRLAEDT